MSSASSIDADYPFPVPASLFAENRARLVTHLQSQGQKGVALLEGGQENNLYDTDTEAQVFRQDAWFWWAFGVEEADCKAVIDLETGGAILFIPQLPAEYAVWMGAILPPSHFEGKYGLKVMYTSELSVYLEDRRPTAVHVLMGVNSDSGVSPKATTVPSLPHSTVVEDFLYPAMAALRSVKTEAEMKVFRYVSRISSAAHREVIRTTAPGMREYHLDANFRAFCYSAGMCRHAAYSSICATGSSGAILHYGHAGAPNKKIIRDGDMILNDMGGEYCRFAADITVAYPANGVFTRDQRDIYMTVLRAQEAVKGQLRAGVNWVDMHTLAYRVIVEGLKDIGILTGNVEDMMAANVGAVFMPHGLGHFLGFAVHDVGGYPEGGPERPTAPGFRKLRTAKTLVAGNFITVEPGIYFNDFSLDEALKNDTLKHFINVEVLNRFRGFGGVRLEDNVLIKDDGIECLTSVPRQPEEIEELMRSPVPISTDAARYV